MHSACAAAGVGGKVGGVPGAPGASRLVKAAGRWAGMAAMASCRKPIHSSSVVQWPARGRTSRHGPSCLPNLNQVNRSEASTGPRTWPGGVVGRGGGEVSRRESRDATARGQAVLATTATINTKRPEYTKRPGTQLQRLDLPVRKQDRPLGRPTCGHPYLPPQAACCQGCLRLLHLVPLPWQARRAPLLQ